MITELTALVLGVTTPISDYSKAFKCPLSYQTHGNPQAIVSNQQQAQPNTRVELLENLFSKYSSNPVYERKLNNGIFLHIAGYKFGIRIDSMETIKTLELFDGEFYYDDRGLKGVDDFGKYSVKLGREQDTIRKKPIRLDTSNPLYRTLQESRNKVQLAIINVLLAHLKSEDVESAIEGYKKAKAELNIILGMYTS